MEEAQYVSTSNSNKTIKSSLQTLDISAADSISYCFQFLLSLLALFSVHPFLFILTGLSPYTLHEHLIQNKALCNLCLSIIPPVWSTDVLTVGGDSENVHHLTVREGTGSMRREIWFQRLMGMLFRRVCPPTWTWITSLCPFVDTWAQPSSAFIQPEDRTDPFL